MHRLEEREREREREREGEVKEREREQGERQRSSLGGCRHNETIWLDMGGIWLDAMRFDSIAALLIFLLLGAAIVHLICLTLLLSILLPYFPS